MMRTKFLARTALGLALAFGVAAGTASPVMAKDKDKAADAAPKLAPSKNYIPAYKAAADALKAAGARPDVMAASKASHDAADAWRSAPNAKASAAAKAKFDAAAAAVSALLTNERALVAASTAAATTPDDKFLAGSLELALGDMIVDTKLNLHGAQLKLDSGKIAAADRPKFLMFIGGQSSDLGDYAGARTAFQAASDAGAAPGEAMIELAKAYIKDNQYPAGLKVLHDAYVKAGPAANPQWLSYGIAMAYKAKLPNEASTFASDLLAAAPTKDNWGLAIAVIRDLNNYQGYDQIALLRLFDRTGSYMEGRDYVDYIQALSKRALPGEQLKIVDAGVASGMLKASDPFVSDSRREATTRMASDKATLAAQERDARAASATSATTTAAADTFLSYDQPAKAEELYKLALTKPGVDAGRANLGLGIALADQKKYAEAQTVLASVKDSRAPIAQLWIAYAKARAAGK